MRFSNAESRKGIVGWGLKRKEPWGATVILVSRFAMPSSIWWILS